MSGFVLPIYAAAFILYLNLFINANQHTHFYHANIVSKRVCIRRV